MGTKKPVRIVSYILILLSVNKFRINSMHVYTKLSKVNYLINILISLCIQKSNLLKKSKPNYLNTLFLNFSLCFTRQTRRDHGMFVCCISGGILCGKVAFD